MEYISTRGSAPTLDFRAATLAGLASDGGLYLPARWPQMAVEDIRALAGLDYAETAVRVMRPFVEGVLTEDELRQLCRAAYGSFSHDAVTPLVQLDHRHWLLELFHGPTLAFKDVALQLLGQLFEKFLSGGDTNITIVGATSGDTGSAAIEAVAGREHIQIFMLHPEGRVSDVQRRQMTTVLTPNVHNIALDGSFDDAQAMVKRLFGDDEARGQLTLSAVNSINWARLMAQVVYYFYAAVRLGGPDRPIAFSVPTGNFGDVFAGYVAAQMGLPIARLVVATNVNDILHRALTNGDYSAGTVTATATPSMDIQVSSNFERLLFDLSGRDGAAITAMMGEFDRNRAMTIPADMLTGARGLFSSASIDGDAMALALRWAQEHGGQVIDPHSAVGLAAARALEIDADIPVVTLATAHPAKFREAVERSTGVRPSLPPRLGNLFDREERYERLPGDYDAVKAYVLAEAARG
ncbi:threonine synthase [Sphingopyxis bauzanensis]|uniref:Threonine synthase n=1 Tax=Sphingopyxis bauzanensis TaxID=651663 RepID=A0A246K0C1_9SPHN|nr:threonine synthase [Sphingopyxis bauzanensis]OWQ98898.1 threonine synthase [Sphingopyxis bauzanensis]GGJ63233.1 threonine synthase [Sphingopyxis bauzanensis]